MESRATSRVSRRLALRFLAPAAIAAIGAGAVRAQALDQQELSPPIASFSQYFGSALAADGDVMVVGAPNDASGPAPGGGGAVVYRRDPASGKWNFEQHLYAGDPEGGANFGASVAVSGDVVAVGAPLHDAAGFTDDGVVYVFRCAAGVWSQEQKLVASNSGATFKFGQSVALSGDRLVAGAPNANTVRGTSSGSAFVFHYQGTVTLWSEEQQLVDPDGAHADQAGADVAIDGTTVAVGSAASTDSSAQSGSVGVWTLSGTTWTQVQELLPTATSANLQFGASLCLRGNQLLVGAPNEEFSPSIPACGAAYLFERSATFTLNEHFVAPAPDTVLGFGLDVAVDGNLVVIGQPYDDGFAGDAGSAWIFRRRSSKKPWVQDQLLSRAPPGIFENLGVCVALTATDIALGARYCDAYGADEGAVDVYSAAESTLVITPPAPKPGALLDIAAFRGDPGDVVMIVIQDVSGTPLFLPLLTTVFAADHAFDLQVNAPNPAYGLHVGMRAWKISPTGRVVVSALAYVDV